MIKSLTHQKLLSTLSSCTLFSATLLSVFICVMKTSHPVNASSLYADIYRLCSLKSHYPDKITDLDPLLFNDLAVANFPPKPEHKDVPESSQNIGIFCLGILGLGILVKRRMQKN